MHLVLNIIMHSLMRNNIKTMCLILCKAASRHQNSSEPSAMQFWGVTVCGQMNGLKVFISYGEPESRPSSSGPWGLTC